MSSLETNARLALSLMDLTSLNDDDNNETILALCQQANTAEGAPAAICVYPQFIKVAREYLTDLGLSQVKIATVTNFPHGSSDIQQAVLQTTAAVEDGADEVDVVFPYQALLAGDEQVGFELVSQCKAACKDTALLKVIIETGVLKSPEFILQASNIAIAAGADFIKTSTGKVAVNATPEAAEIMLGAIKNSGKEIGFKAAGGVKTVADASQYLAIAEKIFGPQWINSAHFRFGASSLLGNVLATLGHTTNNQSSAKY